MVEPALDGSWDVIVAPWHLDEPLAGFPLPPRATALAFPSSGAPRRGDGQDVRVAALCESVAAAVARARRPLVLSGDCVASLGVVAGLQRAGTDVAIVWLDAHGDYNTPATTITGYLGGMPLALLAGHSPALIGDRLGLRPVAECDVVLVDARDLDPAERDLLAASQVRHVPLDVDAVGSAVAALAGRPVYLHVDLDIVDSAELAGLRVPAGSGPALALVADCVAAIASAARIAAAGIACTFLPGRAGDPAARSAIARMGSALGAAGLAQEAARCDQPGR